MFGNEEENIGISADMLVIFLDIVTRNLVFQNKTIFKKIYRTT